MAEQLNHHNDPTGLLASAKQAANAGYLGDRELVDRLVRDFAGGVMNRFDQVGDGRLTPNDAAEADKAECQRLARVFLGQDPQYAPQPGWNGSGLAMYVRVRMKEAVQPEDDESVLAQVFAMLAHVIYDQIRNTTDAAKMAEQINEAIRSLSWLLLGLEQHD